MWFWRLITCIIVCSREAPDTAQCERFLAATALSPKPPQCQGCTQTLLPVPFLRGSTCGSHFSQLGIKQSLGVTAKDNGNCSVRDRTVPHTHPHLLVLNSSDYSLGALVQRSYIPPMGSAHAHQISWGFNFIYHFTPIHTTALAGGLHRRASWYFQLDKGSALHPGRAGGSWWLTPHTWSSCACSSPVCFHRGFWANIALDSWKYS